MDPEKPNIGSDSYSSSKLTGYVLIISAATMWGLAAAAAKFLFNKSFDVFLVVQTRSLMSCIVLWIFFLSFRRRSIRKLNFRQWYPFALLGICGIAGSNWTYYKAMQLRNVSTAIILQYTAPILVMLYEVLRKRDTLSPYNVSALALSLLGCYLTVGGYYALLGHMNIEGLLWAILSAFVFAFFNLYGKNVLTKYTAWTGMLYSITFTSLFWFLFRPPWSLIGSNISLHDWGVLFIFAMCSILIPYSLYFQGLKLIRSSHAIIIATLEPIVASVSAAFIVNELLTGWQYMGAACVIAAIVILSKHHEREITRWIDTSTPAAFGAQYFIAEENSG